MKIDSATEEKSSANENKVFAMNVIKLPKSGQRAGKAIEMWPR
jgi:hypothetical protein